MVKIWWYVTLAVRLSPGNCLPLPRLTLSQRSRLQVDQAHLEIRYLLYQMFVMAEVSRPIPQ